MAITAVEPQLSDVQFVAIGDGLLPWNTDRGDVWRTHHTSRNQRQTSNDENHHSYTRTGQRVRPAAKNLRHTCESKLGNDFFFRAIAIECSGQLAGDLRRLSSFDLVALEQVDKLSVA